MHAIHKIPYIYIYIYIYGVYSFFGREITKCKVIYIWRIYTALANPKKEASLSETPLWRVCVCVCVCVVLHVIA